MMGINKRERVKDEPLVRERHFLHRDPGVPENTVTKLLVIEI